VDSLRGDLVTLGLTPALPVPMMARMIYVTGRADAAGAQAAKAIARGRAAS
jgi:hypothetical protein